MNTGLQIWQPPKEGHRYVIGADPSHGLPNSADTAIDVTDANTTDTVATCTGPLNPIQLAHMLIVVGAYYNWGFLVVEANNHGHAVLQELTRPVKPPHIPTMYPEDLIYMDMNLVKENMPTMRMGFVSNSVSRPIMVERLIRWVNQKEGTWPDPETVKQAGWFVQKPNERFEARDKGKKVGTTANDDRVIVKGISLVGVAAVREDDPWRYAKLPDAQGWAAAVLMGELPDLDTKPRGWNGANESAWLEMKSYWKRRNPGMKFSRQDYLDTFVDQEGQSEGVFIDERFGQL